MNQVRRWIREHPWAMSSFLVGILVGAALCLPLVPFEMPESSANLLGAALGAGTAVWLAASVAEGKERIRERLARNAILTAVLPIEPAAIGLIQALEGLPDVPVLEHIVLARERADALYSACDHAAKRNKAIKPIYVGLGTTGILSYFEVKRRIKYLLEAASGVDSKLGYRGEDLRTLTRTHAAAIRNDLNGLVSAAKSA